MCPQKNERLFHWIGSSRKDLEKLPKEVQDLIGFDLDEIENGTTPHSSKYLKGFKRVQQITSNYDKNTYRTVYTTKFEGFVFVLHVFKKKAKRDTKTPDKEIKLIRKRLKIAQSIYERHSTGK